MMNIHILRTYFCRLLLLACGFLFVALVPSLSLLLAHSLARARLSHFSLSDALHQNPMPEGIYETNTTTKWQISVWKNQTMRICSV